MIKDKCICGSEQIAEFLFLKKENKIILRCKKCGLGWTYPPPTVSYEVYDFAYYFVHKKVHQSRAKQILGLLRLFKNKGKLLELGCGPGFLLELAKESGFQIKGIEISDITVQKAQELLGINVVQKIDATDFNYEGQLYDCIVMDNFLEHIQDPLQLLIKVKSILKDEGLIVVCSPSIDGLYVKFIKGDSYILRPDEHIWQFSIMSIKNLLKKTGYSPIRIKAIGFINRQIFLHNLKFFGINRTFIKNLFLNSLNYILGKLGFGDMFIAVAKKL